MLRRNGHHKPEFAYDIVRIDFLLIYLVLIEYNAVGDTKSFVIRYFPLIKS